MVQDAFFVVFIQHLAEGKGRWQRERERDLVTKNGFKKHKHLNSQLNVHITTNNEKKKYTKQANELLFLRYALFFQRLENVLFHLVVSL